MRPVRIKRLEIKKRAPFLDPLFCCAIRAALLLADAEDLRAANGADALSGRPSVLHRNGLGTLNLPLRATLYTICLHICTSSLSRLADLALRLVLHSTLVNRGQARILLFLRLFTPVFRGEYQHLQ